VVFHTSYCPRVFLQLLVLFVVVVVVVAGGLCENCTSPDHVYSGNTTTVYVASKRKRRMKTFGAVAA
jgi:hypothetical protein